MCSSSVSRHIVIMLVGDVVGVTKDACYDRGSAF